ncbi:hypothetical protein [Planomonospora parontospora]|uniref:hypothetical protein n=1 Tax=Planomonospora parontospora TaxID=58119 RepID=UPI00166FF88B|nr:hypothetical protein [Planomonospora parontospora]
MAGVDAAGRAITGALLPEDSFEAEQQVTIALAAWQSTPVCKNVEFRCRIHVSLPERDAVRYEPFAEARRTARLATVLAEDASTDLLRTHLSDVTSARLWWLKQYLDQPGQDLSWKVFDEHVRPLIADAHRPERDIDRLARIILTSTDRISDDPTRLETFLQVLEKTFEIMGWPDLSADVGTLSERPG